MPQMAPLLWLILFMFFFMMFIMFNIMNYYNFFSNSPKNLSYSNQIKNMNWKW
uniref:ATP synthase complex subunit 8 n=1 Tax=Haplosialis sp. TaxID=2900217 RepID=A0A8K1WBJ3_9NEOP|nr:ATP synthase F0 subunit 8 [Haplosialis sp.]